MDLYIYIYGVDLFPPDSFRRPLVSVGPPKLSALSRLLLVATAGQSDLLQLLPATGNMWDMSDVKLLKHWGLSMSSNMRVLTSTCPC